MLQGYIDDSVEDGHALIMAGPIATIDRWNAFSVEWQKRLEHARWPIFKMANVAHRGSDEALEHAKWHYYTLRDHAQGAVCMVVPIAPLQRAAIKYDLVGTAAANPYTWALKGVINATAKNQMAWGANESIEFIFDERPEERQIHEVWIHYLATITNNIRNLTGPRPQFRNDKDVLPLQAADMWAWWCRKTWKDNGGHIPPNSYPIPWGRVGEIPQMIFQWEAEEIEAELARVASALSALRMKQPS